MKALSKIALLVCALASAAQEVSFKEPGWVASVAFSSDGKLLANACSDSTARLHDNASGAELGIFRGHTDCVVALAFAPDGKRLASGSYDCTARIWDVSS